MQLECVILPGSDGLLRVLIPSQNFACHWDYDTTIIQLGKALQLCYISWNQLFTQLSQSSFTCAHGKLQNSRQVITVCLLLIGMLGYVGKAIKGRRHKVQLCTKFALVLDSTGLHIDGSRKHARCNICLDLFAASAENNASVIGLIRQTPSTTK